MRKILITIVAMLLSVLFVLGSVVVINAESTKAAIPDDAIVTYGALKEYLEQFKQEETNRKENTKDEYWRRRS